MKTPTDPRHQHRIKLIKDLYQYSFQQKYSYSGTRKIINALSEIDKLIEKAAQQWPIQKLNRIDLAILRLAVFELNIDNKTPPRVVIDEAVELAKEFGSGNSPKFVNGALGFLIRKGESQK